MGAQQSSPQLTLAEKRYKVGSPKTTKQKNKKQKRKSSSVDGIHKITVSNSTNQICPVSKPSKLATIKNQSSSETQTSISSKSSSERATSLRLHSISNLENGELLSKTQKILIENSWKRSRKSGADNVGTKIFLLVLTAQPDIKMIFGLEKIPQGRLKYDPRFRKHAVVFNRTFDYIVKNLNYTEKLIQHFRALGKKHVLMQGRGFLPQYWITFAECMTQTAVEWEGGQRCRETMVSWRILVAFIIHQMKIGFDDERSNRKKFSMMAMQMSLTKNECCPENRAKNLPRSASQQFLKLPGHENLVHKLSYQENSQSNTTFDKLNSEFDQKCSLSPRDNGSQKTVFFTPPSSRLSIRLNSVKQSSCSNIPTFQLDSGTESDDDEWSSPRKSPAMPFKYPIKCD